MKKEEEEEVKAGRSLNNLTLLNQTKLLSTAHLDSLGLYWNKIDDHNENILQ